MNLALRHLEAAARVLLSLLDFLARELPGEHRVEAFDAGGDLAVGDALHFQRMQMAEFGDLLEAERSIVDQPHGGRLRHQQEGHGENLLFWRIDLILKRKNLRPRLGLAAGASFAITYGGNGSAYRRFAPR